MAFAHTASHLIVESNQFGLVNTCWLFAITFMSFMCLDVASQRICSITFPGTKIRQTRLSFPGSFSLSSLKTRVTFTHVQSSGTSPDHHNLPKTIEWPLNDIGQLLQQPLLHPIWSCGFVYVQLASMLLKFYDGCCFTPTDCY